MRLADKRHFSLSLLNEHLHSFPLPKPAPQSFKRFGFLFRHSQGSITILNEFCSLKLCNIKSRSIQRRAGLQQLHKFRVTSTNYDANFIENVINVFIFAVKHKCNLMFDLYKMAVRTYGIQKKKVVKNIQYGEYVYTMLQLIIKRNFLATSLSNLATYFSNICSKTY